MEGGNTELHLTEKKQLTESLRKRLAAYALAATATAGIGLAAAGAPAEASIISHTTSLTVSCTPTSASGGFGCHGQGILNIVDAVHLTFKEFLTFAVGSGGGRSLNVVPHGAVVNVATTFRGFNIGAVNLAKGDRIGPGDVLRGGSVLMTRTFPPMSGSGFWARGAGYLGFSFSGHFGWIAASVANNYASKFGLHVNGFAYDTVVGQTIDAGQTTAVPEPGTLTLLALGALGLFELRRRRRAAVSKQQSADR